ncbi:hypothetical protein ACFFLZ_17530 [Photobacterium aphoticum]|nr:hypothetical protein [Photobacterium aphoticum]GHA57863.1 hypothetical protein GCM10007086_34700 [Photobacterium aphoticum]
MDRQVLVRNIRYMERELREMREQLSALDEQQKQCEPLDHPDNVLYLKQG